MSKILGHALGSLVTMQGIPPKGLEQVVTELYVAVADILVGDDHQSAPEIPGINGQELRGGSQRNIHQPTAYRLLKVRCEYPAVTGEWNVFRLCYGLECRDLFYGGRAVGVRLSWS